MKGIIIKNTRIIVTTRLAPGYGKKLFFDALFKADENTVRNFTRRALFAAQKNKVNSLTFCSLPGTAKPFPYAAASKIMAQEAFGYLRETKNPSLKNIFFVVPAGNIFRLFKKNVESYLKYMIYKLSAGPYLTVDGIIQYQGGIVLIERSNPPLGWAIPGGFVDYGESVETAVAREVKEETNLDFKDFQLFKVCSAPNRDPRFHTVSVVFVGKGKGVLKAASDAQNAKVFKLNCLPAKIAFDHRKVIEEYIRRFRLQTIDRRPKTQKRCKKLDVRS